MKGVLLIASIMKFIIFYLTALEEAHNGIYAMMPHDGFYSAGYNLWQPLIFKLKKFDN